MMQQQAAQENANQQANFQNLQAKYRAMGMSADQANQAAALQFEQMKMGANQFNTSANNAAAAQQKAFTQGLFGKIAGAGASAAMMGAGGAPAAAAEDPIDSAETNPMAQPGGSMAAKPKNPFEED
jgi:hypothetical protein